jgi:putative PIN family toxin of toxin-antitoxin system
MRVIIDTNVLVSGIFFKGPPYSILQAWRDGLVQLVVSNSILSEYSETTKRISLKYPAIDISSLLELLTIKSEVVAEKVIDKKISRHQLDDKFIHCAKAGKVLIIISGDKHLLELHPYENIEILSPTVFTNRFLKKPEEEPKEE